MTVLSRGTANPEMANQDATYLADIAERAERFVARFCGLKRFPKLEQGKSVSAASPSEDISSLSTNEFAISVNGIDSNAVSITLAALTSGAAIATEMQTQIRAVDVDGYDEVTVVFTTVYTITSGRYQEESAIVLGFDESKKHVLQALKLSPAYGGVETVGGKLDQELEDAAVIIMEAMDKKLGLEGFSGGAVPGDITFEITDIDPIAKNIMMNRRRWL